MNTSGKDKILTIAIELDMEADGRWIAEVPEFPGAMAYGTSKENAIARVKALALRIFADQLENSERSYTVNTIIFRDQRGREMMKPISELTADELQAEIAEKRGWKLSEPPFKSSNTVEWLTPGGGVGTSLPKWTTEISAAWGVLEEMKRHPLVVNVKLNISNNVKITFLEYRPIPHNNAIIYEADTAPLAICRAWLAWKRDQP